jgi:hypothetical protein
MNEPQPGSALTQEDIAEYLATADDFAFEREVYHVAKRLQFDVEHGAVYRDPATEKHRQFDIRASATLEHQRISLAIECKGLKPDFPLLVSCVPREPREAHHQILFASDVMGEGSSFTRVKPVHRAQQPCMYPVSEGVGKSMRQIRRERRGNMASGDDVFDKWMQALASLTELVEIGAHQLRTGARQSLRQIAFLPVLVVSDETLWVADYSSRGDLQRTPFQVADITYYLGRKYPLEREHVSLTVTHLHITTRSAVRPWLEEIANGGGIWQELFAG